MGAPPLPEQPAAKKPRTASQATAGSQGARGWAGQDGAGRGCDGVGEGQHCCLNMSARGREHAGGWLARREARDIAAVGFAAEVLPVPEPAGAPARITRPAGSGLSGLPKVTGAEVVPGSNKVKLKLSRPKPAASDAGAPGGVLCCYAWGRRQRASGLGLSCS